MISYLLTQIAQVETWSYITDELGNQVRDTKTIQSNPARLEQTDATEITVGRSTEISNWSLLLPPLTAVQPQSTVVVDGATFEVIGLPEVHHTPSGPHHVQARLRLVT